MDDMPAQIWKVQVTRKRRRWALVILIGWLGLAVLRFGQDWTRGKLDADTAIMVFVYVVGGLLLWGSIQEFNALVLRVDRGHLKVNTQMRPAFLGPNLSVPIPEVALEWVDDRLLLQWPQGGRDLLLASSPQARDLAEWLVARGARPPVGG